MDSSDSTQNTWGRVKTSKKASTCTKSLAQSRKKTVFGKSTASHRAATSVTAVDSDDEDADGDGTMEPSDKPESEDEVEDDESELSKTKSIFI